MCSSHIASSNSVRKLAEFLLYCHAGCEDVLEEDIRRLTSGGSGFRALVYDCVDSTNTRLAQLAQEGAPEYTAVIASAQTAGRGRAGHSFYSPAGSGVYFSLLLRPGFAPETAAQLITPACAVAAAETIEAVSGERARIKWVNDVYVRGRKVCGVLTEARQDGRGGLAWVVAGIGINISCPRGGWPEGLDGLAGQVYEGEAPDMAAAELAVGTLERLIGLYRAMPASDFRAEYSRRLLLTPRPEGQPLGVDEDFRLLLRDASGRVTALESAG